MDSRQLLIEDFVRLPDTGKGKKSVWRFDMLVRAYERSTGKIFHDLDELIAWANEIQGRPGFKHLRAARWNPGNMKLAYERWIRTRGPSTGKCEKEKQGTNRGDMDHNSGVSPSSSPSPGNRFTGDNPYFPR